MLNKNEELKTASLCTVALLLGVLIVVLTGCDKIITKDAQLETIIPTSKYKMHDLTYPASEYDLNKVA